MRDGENLVKLTLLDGNAEKPLLEQFPNTFPPINCKGFKSESCGREVVETTIIVFHLLTRNFFPVQIASIGTTDQHTIRPLEERCVYDEIHRLFFDDNFTRSTRISIEIFSKGLRIFTISLSEIIVRLAALGVVVVGMFHPSFFFLVSTDKLTTTNRTPKLLTTGLMSIFPDPERAAGGTLFLGIKNWEKNCSYSSPKVLKSAFINSLRAESSFGSFG